MTSTTELLRTQRSVADASEVHGMVSTPAPLVAALQDRYRVERELGRGGMATVYLGQDPRHNRMVAIKVLRPELSGMLGRDRFLREIAIASQLQHPNILPLFDSGSTHDFLYYVMPFVEGESLRELLDREKQLAVDDALAIAREVADALAYAHARGVVHRDIKPGNILLSGGHALVADFGLARAITVAGGVELTTSGLAVGTPAYMSPEQGSGEEGVDARSDLYSLACVLYEMLAGQPPFTGRTAQAIVARHLTEAPPSIRVVRPSVPVQVERAIETALSKVRADRFPSVEKFVGALAETRGARARPGRLPALLAVVLLVLAGAAGWLMLGRRRALDPNKVVVFPLVEIGRPRESEGLGEAIAVIIESALERSEPLRWIDGWQHLDAARRQDPAGLTSEDARRIARARAARWYTTGSIVRRGDSVTVVLRLSDAEGDSVIGQASTTAPAAQAPQVGLGLVSRLLVPFLAPGRQLDLTSLGDRRPGAVAAWLQGERQYRRGNFDSALVFLRRAVEEDSALAVAAVRGAQAASWKNISSEAAALADVALQHAELLPRRQEELTRGLADYLAGRADSAVQWLNRALGRHPDWVEAHMLLGEVYHHLLPQAPYALDSLARLQFTAAAADTGFAPPQFHLAEIALRQGDLAHAEKAARRFEGAGSGTEERRELRLMLACARDGPGAVDWRAAARESPAVLFSVAKMLSVAGAYVGCAEAASRALLTERNTDDFTHGAFLLLQYVLAAQGRTGAIVALVDSLNAAGWWQVTGTVYLVDALAGLPDMAPRVTETLAAFREHYGNRYEDSLDGGVLLLLASWYARSDQIADATRLHGMLVRRAADAPGPEADRRAAAAAATLLLAQGDSAAALEALAGASPVAPRDLLTWGYSEAGPVERLTQAELLYSRARYEQAIRVADEFDHPTPAVYLAFLPPSLALRHRAAVALGQPGRASRYRERLTALGWADLLAVHD